MTRTTREIEQDANYETAKILTVFMVILFFAGMFFNAYKYNELKDELSKEVCHNETEYEIITYLCLAGDEDCPKVCNGNLVDFKDGGMNKLCITTKEVCEIK